MEARTSKIARQRLLPCGDKPSPTIRRPEVATGSDNILLGYLYGGSKALAAMGAPFWRGEYSEVPVLMNTLKVNNVPTLDCNQTPAHLFCVEP